MAQHPGPDFIAGLEHRFYPIDIENVPPGAYSSNGLPPADTRFWKARSIYAGITQKLNRYWAAGFLVFTRYNQLHWKTGVNFNRPEPIKRSDKKNFKYDVLLNIQRSVFYRERKGKAAAVITGAAAGIANLNTRFSVQIQDTLDTGPTSWKTYKGNMAHFAGRLYIGYQYHRYMAVFSALFTNGPSQTNLTTFWPGISLGYEFRLKPRRHQ